MVKETKATVDQTAQTAKATIEQASQMSKEEPPLVVSAGGKLVLAAIGAVGLAQDSLEHLLKRMVARGELSQKDARKLVAQLRTKRPNPFARGMQTSTGAVPTPEDLPTKSDIQSLHGEIAALSAKLDQMNAERQGSPKP